MEIKIRKGTENDIPAVLDLIKELAVYEKAPHEVTVTVSQMKVWGFGDDKLFDFFVAEYEGVIIGLALYYFKYSTWKGKCLFLEDIVVNERFRRLGAGTLLFEAVLSVAHDLKVGRMEWQVLEWNTPAIQFYKKWSTVFDEEWINCKIIQP